MLAEDRAIRTEYPNVSFGSHHGVHGALVYRDIERVRIKFEIPYIHLVPYISGGQSMHTRGQGARTFHHRSQS